MSEANEYREQASVAEEQPAVPRKSRLRKIQDFDFSLNKENATKMIPFVLLVTGWVILYIANHQYGEKTLGRMDKLRKELKELKADFYTSNAELSDQTIQSQVAKKVEPMGLKELTTPPQRMRLLKSER